MSLGLQLVAFFAIFATIFGGLVVVSRGLERRQAREEDEAEPRSTQREPTPEPDPELSAMALRLKRAGINLAPDQFRRRVLRTALIVAIVGIIMGGMGIGGLIFGLLLGFGVYKGSDYYIEWKHQQRNNEFTDQFCDGLGVMANGVKSGQTILQTLETIATDFTEPIQGEVTEVLQELRMGVALDEALNHWVDRMPLEDLEIAATALIVQRQTGGNVAEILDILATTIRERNKLQKQIRVMTTQGRMSGVVMSLLPVGLFLAMYLIAPARTSLLLTHPIGLLLTATGIGGILLGSYFIKRIVTIEV